MPKATVVTAFVPLKVLHLSPQSYKDYGRRLEDACDGRLLWFDDFALNRCWLYLWLWDYLHGEPLRLSPASATPTDRYADAHDHVCSNIVQHSRTQWALMAAEQKLQSDVFVWLDLGILKQGDFTGKQVTAQHVRDFLKRVEDYEFKDIPFPGIEGRKPVDVHGNNWRFCGSTHIWPRWALPRIDHHYKFHCREFIRQHQCIPLDLAVWPTVEERSGLPFKWYKAEYDHTQLTEFPHARPDPPL